VDRGDVVTDSPSEYELDPAINPVTEPSRFCLQVYNVGTPRGADAILVEGFLASVEGVEGGDEVSLSLCPKLRNPRETVARGGASATTFSDCCALERFASASRCLALAASCAALRF